MLYFCVVIIGIIIWTISGIIWFLLSLKRKTKPNRWYDYIFSPPVLCTCTIIGFFES